MGLKSLINLKSHKIFLKLGQMIEMYFEIKNIVVLLQSLE